MILRGIDFGHVCTSSGARNFFQEDGYWYHRPAQVCGLSFYWTTFVAKTTTLHARAGNMPLRRGRFPREWKPRCIKVYFRQGMTLNAVGLSGPGAEWLLKRGRWQRYTEPFFLSFMAVHEALARRRREYADFVALLKNFLPDFEAPVGLQVNISCPNVGLGADKLMSEADAALDILAELEIPIIPKVCASLPVDLARCLSEHPAVDAIAATNAVPWGALPDQIDWGGLFGSEESPLAEFGGGALSGAPLYPIVCDWVVRARAAGVTKPILAGGGVQRPWQAAQLLRLGASAIEIGTVYLLRPWRVRRITEHVRTLLSQHSEAQQKGAIDDIPVAATR